MIFCFEEDANVLKIMLAALNDAGFEAQGFGKSSELFDELSGKRANLVIADVSCEKGDGSAILSELREKSASGGFSILLVTTKWMKLNRLSGIDFRDEVCLFKPFNVTQLMQAVNKAIRCGCEDEGKILEFGNLRFNVSANEVTVDGKEIPLTRKEYTLLSILMDNTEQVFTREQLFNCVWQSDYLGQSRTVDVHVGTLRRKLKSAGQYIKTVRGKGYCMQEI